jgi:hypothetical protein
VQTSSLLTVLVGAKEGWRLKRGFLEIEKKLKIHLVQVTKT